MINVKIITYVLLVLVVIAAAMAFAYGSVVRLAFIGVSDYREIAPKLYVSPSISNLHDESIKEMIVEGRVRLAHHFGVPVARPTIVVLADGPESDKFELGDAPGKLWIAPWGNYLLLHLDKAGVDVAAHELVHAEIAHRLGYIDRMRKIPTWLDEGIALQVDYRAEYAQIPALNENELDRVTSLEKPAQFWTPDPEQNIENYRSSKVAVNMTLFGTRTQGSLYELLERLSGGEDLSNLLAADQTTPLRFK